MQCARHCAESYVHYIHLLTYPRVIVEELETSDLSRETGILPQQFGSPNAAITMFPYLNLCGPSLTTNRPNSHTFEIHTHTTHTFRHHICWQTASNQPRHVPFKYNFPLFKVQTSMNFYRVNMPRGPVPRAPPSPFQAQGCLLFWFLTP